MEELLVAITRGLVDQPDAVTVEVDQPDDEGVIVYHLHVAESDTGHRQAGSYCKGHPRGYARCRHPLRRENCGGDRLIKSVNKKDLCIGTGPFLCCEFHTVKCLFCRSGR